MKKILFGLLISSWMLACNQATHEPVSAEMENELLAKGDSVSSEAQRILLQNVSGAIQAGGTEHAVEFCNIKAIPLTDSVAAVYDMTIQRLTDKPRNHNNEISTETDKKAWQEIQEKNAHFIRQEKDGSVFYYKPIMVAMPTCLSCHGDKAEIASATLQMIQEKYPDDKAIGYKAGELRGMWKLNMSTYEQLLRSRQQ